MASLGNFDNFRYPALPVSFGGDTKAVGPFYLVSIDARGSKITDTGG